MLNTQFGLWWIDRFGIEFRLIDIMYSSDVGSEIYTRHDCCNLAFVWHGNDRRNAGGSKRDEDSKDCDQCYSPLCGRR